MKIKLLIIFFILFQSAYSQQLTTKSKKAQKLYNQALHYYQLIDLPNCINTLNEALKCDNNFIEAYLLMAEAYRDNNDYQSVILAYNKVIEINPDFFPRTYYFRGRAFLLTGQYENAKNDFVNYQKYSDYATHDKDLINEKLIQCEFGINALKNPLNFKLINLGENINSSYHEYWPCLTADENTLIFTVLVPKASKIPYTQTNSQEDFYLSKKVNGKWQKRKGVGENMNTPENEGAESISADGQTLVFTLCKSGYGQANCDLFISYKTGENWTAPINMGEPINTAAKETQPSLSADGRVLFFVSNREGGKGELDIWQSVRNENGTWSEPINLGDSINTKKSEQAPFIHADNQTLYFTSNGWMGLGGTDLFYSKLNNTKIWSKAKNLGYPINTYKDEMALTINAKGNLALIASEREGGFGGMDIYEFDLPSEIRPNWVTYTKGIVYDSITKAKLEAKFQLINLKTSEIIIESKSNKINGEFLVCLPINNAYCLNVSCDNYLFYSENFSLENVNDTSKLFTLSIPMQPIGIDEHIVLKNIFFDTDSFRIKPESKIELDKLITFLQNNSKLIVEIGGHTDNQGSEEHNLKLSQSRAESVYKYLNSNSIPAKRLKYNGYGSSKPMVGNNSEVNKAKNRRTELKIIDVLK